MISVVIPAHNEERSIERCLRALLRDAKPDEIDVVVACNGCTDRTAEVAAAFGSPVRVVSTEHASKPAALNLGDTKAKGFPRFYLDADVEMSTDALRRVTRELESGRALAAAPRLAVDFEGSSRAVRGYFLIWLELPYVRDALIGSGVYAVSEAGRARFDCFPDIIADDLFVKNLFTEQERLSVAGCSFRIRAPHTLRDLVSRKIRVFAGNRQLRALGGSLARAPLPARRGLAVPGLVHALASRPRAIAYLPVYAWVSLQAKLRALWRSLRGDFQTWDRDESTR